MCRMGWTQHRVDVFRGMQWKDLLYKLLQSMCFFFLFIMFLIGSHFRGGGAGWVNITKPVFSREKERGKRMFPGRGLHIWNIGVPTSQGPVTQHWTLRSHSSYLGWMKGGRKECRCFTYLNSQKLASHTHCWNKVIAELGSWDGRIGCSLWLIGLDTWWLWWELSYSTWLIRWAWQKTNSFAFLFLTSLCYAR